MKNILEVRGLSVRFGPAPAAKAVDGISFDIGPGEVFGLAGESGSGKTLTALSILNLIGEPGKISGGEILYKGADILKMDRRSLRRLRGHKIGMVFQEPSSALDPVFTVGYQIAEAVLAHSKVKKPEAKRRAIEAMKGVHIERPERVYDSYPHQLSGGLRQRSAIAMALVNSPELLILDEPTTALDVTIQAQVLDTILEIKRSSKMSVLFISHDFGAISKMCDRVAVMKSGRIVEAAAVSDVIRRPNDAYTASLIESVKALS